MNFYEISTGSHEGVESGNTEIMSTKINGNFRVIFENSPDAMVLIDDGVIIDCNRMALEMIGCHSRQWLLLKHINDISPARQPDGSLSSEKQKRLFLSVLHTKNDIFEWTHKRSNGDLLPVEVSLTFFQSDGKNIHFAIWREMTRHKKLEEALKESERTARLLIDATDEAIFLVNRKNEIISFNSRFSRNHASHIHDMTGTKIDDFFSEETAKKLKRTIGNVIHERKMMKYEKEEDGSCFEVSLYPINNETDNVSKVAIFMKDVTVERRYEEALRESEKKYRQIVDTANEGILAVNENSRVTLANRQTLKMTGYSEKELIGKMLVDLIHHEDRGLHDEKTRHRIRGEAQRYELRLKKKDASLLWVIVSASPIFNTKNGFRGSIIFFTDITERKRTEEKIGESEERYRTAIEHSNDGVAMLYNDSYIYVNQKFVEIFGYDSVNEIIGQKQSTILRQDEAGPGTTAIERSRADGEVPQRYEFKGKRKDGSSIYIEASSTKTQYRGQMVTLTYLRDVTSRKLIEKDLLNSRKFESIGLIAGGIAHDFNNLLMSILGYISLARIYLKPDDYKASEKLSSAEKAIDKAKDLAVQLLAFSRGGSTVTKVIRLEHMIKDSVKVPLSGSRIKCKYTFREHLWPVKGDESRLKQVIRHLALNAREAMPDGGVITFSARNMAVEKSDETFLRPGDYVELIVADTGKGIAEDLLSHVFDPYFTTKDFGPQKGTGLGLAVCYSIIKKHGGYIEIESAVNKGTTCRLYLPAERQDAATA